MAKLKSVIRAYPKVYEFTVTLAGTSPMIWRRFLAHEIIHLDELHMLIQMTMGWEASHLYEFTFGNKKYAASIHADDSGAENAENAEDVSLRDALGDSRKFSYLYDFGDGCHTKSRSPRLLTTIRLVSTQFVSRAKMRVPQKTVAALRALKS